MIRAFEYLTNLAVRCPLPNPIPSPRGRGLGRGQAMQKFASSIQDTTLSSQ